MASWTKLLVLYLAGCGLVGTTPHHRAHRSPAENTDEDDTASPAGDTGASGSYLPFWYADDDGDGYGHDEYPAQAAEAPVGYVAQGGDCDDARADVNPGMSEVCDIVDDDCDGAVDAEDADVAGLVCTWEDDDGDGWGQDGVGTAMTGLSAGRVARPGDCDDSDPSVHDGAPETVGDGRDTDCDGRDGTSGSQRDARDVATAAIEPPQGSVQSIYALGDVDGDGVRDIWIAGVGIGTESGAEVPFALVEGDLSSPAPLVEGTYHAACPPVDAGDADGDGRDDVWTSVDGYCAQPGLVPASAVLAGDFTAAVVAPAIPDGWWVVAPDTDGDRAHDVVEFVETQAGSGSFERSIAWYQSSNVGQLAEADARTVLRFASSPLYDSSTNGADIGDADGDGWDDLAVVNVDMGDGTLGAYLLGAGDLATGTLDLADVAPVMQNVNSPLGYVMRVGDTDGDGLDDLDVWGSIWTGPPSTWRPRAPSGYQPALAALGDVDGDGFDDLYGAGNADRDFPWRVWFGPITLGGASGYEDLGLEGTYAEPTSTRADFAKAVSVGDVDGDGGNDLVVANRGWCSTSSEDPEWKECKGPAGLWLIAGSAV